MSFCSRFIVLTFLLSLHFQVKWVEHCVDSLIRKPLTFFCLSCKVRNHFNDHPLYSGGDHWWCVLCSWWLTQRERNSRRPNCTHGLEDDGAFRRCYDANWRTYTGEGEVFLILVMWLPTTQKSFHTKIFHLNRNATLTE